MLLLATTTSLDGIGDRMHSMDTLEISNKMLQRDSIFEFYRTLDPIISVTLLKYAELNESLAVAPFRLTSSLAAYNLWKPYVQYPSILTI